MMVEVCVDKKGNRVMGRAYAEPIANFKGVTITEAMQKHVATTARVVADGYTSYSVVEKTYKFLRQEKSLHGLNFQLLHVQIMNLKGWIRGTHSQCSTQHYAGYLNEFHYRFNRRFEKSRNGLFNNLLNRIIKATPLTYPEIAILCGVNT